MEQEGSAKAPHVGAFAYQEDLPRVECADGFGAQFVVAGFVAVDLAQPDDRRCG